MDLRYNEIMHKNKIPLIIAVVVICASLIVCLVLWMSNAHPEKELIYSTTYSFAFGSRRVQIYDNGEVYDDLEIEEPEHKPDYKYVKTLTTEQIDQLKDKKAQNLSEKELSDFVIELVYGVHEFGKTGEY